MDSKDQFRFALTAYDGAVERLIDALERGSDLDAAKAYVMIHHLAVEASADLLGDPMNGPSVIIEGRKMYDEFAKEKGLPT